MKPTIAYTELNEELQELYLESKQWLSDLKFLDQEFVFLKKLLVAAVSPLVQHDEFERIPDILVSAMKTAKNQEALKHEIIMYLHILEKYIIDSEHFMEISLIQKHTNLEADLEKLKTSFSSVKALVINLSKSGMKEKMWQPTFRNLTTEKPD